MATYWVVKDDDDCYFSRSLLGGRMAFVRDRGNAKKYTTLRKALAGARLCRRIWGGEIRVMRVGPEVARDVILTGEAARLVREWRDKGRRADVHGASRYITPLAGNVLAALASEEVRDG